MSTTFLRLRVRGGGDEHEARGGQARSSSGGGSFGYEFETGGTVSADEVADHDGEPAGLDGPRIVGSPELEVVGAEGEA